MCFQEWRHDLSEMAIKQDKNKPPTHKHSKTVEVSKLEYWVLLAYSHQSFLIKAQFFLLFIFIFGSRFWHLNDKSSTSWLLVIRKNLTHCNLQMDVTFMFDKNLKAFMKSIPSYLNYLVVHCIHQQKVLLWLIKQFVCGIVKILMFCINKFLWYIYCILNLDR